ncbi:MAG: recombinase family protein [Coprobacillus cateniformis]
MKKRVAAYCRISSNSKEQQTSGDAQVMYYINLIYNNDDYIVIGIFYDVGSGLRTKNRKNYLKLKNIIENNGIDILFCKSLARISRDSLELIKFIRLLIENDVVVNEGGKMIYDLKDKMFNYEIYAVIYQWESQIKSDAIKWAYKRGFENGSVYMTNLYGYSSKNNNIKIIEYQANIVKEAFSLYLEGMSEYEIAKSFENRGYINKSGKTSWSYLKIRDMLTNEKYIGQTIGPKTYCKDIITGKRYVNDCFNQYLLEGSHPQIISKTIFDEVQRKIKDNKTNGYRKRKDETALARKIICGECGAFYIRKTYLNRDKSVRTYMWKCSKANKKQCEKSMSFHEAYIIDKIIEFLKIKL